MTARRRPQEPPAQADLALPVREGVHLRMPESAYFDARAIGSTDLKTLYWDPTSWWYASDYNPERRVRVKQQRRTALDLGSALHALVLEGEDAYAGRFTVEPDSASNRYLRKRAEIAVLLKSRGHEIPRGDFSNATLHRLIHKAGIAHLVWDTAFQSYESAKQQGRQHISTDEDRRLRHTAHLIASHDELGPAMRGGLSEVSVFWRREDDPDTLMRARFDKLRVQRIYDLKSIGNWKGRDIDAAIREAIENNDYDIQRRLYPEAFAALQRFVREGQIFGWAPDGGQASVIQEDRGYLNQVADGGEPAWIWVFVQIRCDDVGKERAPLVAPRWHKPAGALWDNAGLKIDKALAAYRNLRTEFGIHRPWAFIDDTKELTDGDFYSRMKREIA